MTQLLLRKALSPPSGSPPPGLPLAEPVCRHPISAMELTLVTSIDGLMAIEPEWADLFESSARPTHVFQSFNWCWHWCRHYLGGDASNGPRLSIVVGRLSGKLALVMPLVTQRTAGLTELVWLGEPVSQYGDILASDDASDIQSLERAWQFAVAETKADVANLRRVRSDAVAAPLLARLDATVTAVEEAPYLALGNDHSFGAWEERRQPRARKNRRRQARRLTEKGHVRFSSHCSTSEAAALAMHAVELKRGTLHAKGAISPALSDPRFAAFFADAAGATGRRPAGVVVKTLEVGDDLAAIKVLVDCKGSRFLHIAVFDPAYEKCGAGAVLLENAVGKTIEQGCKTLDLLPPRHEYKMDFADGVVLVSDHAMALSRKGWLYTQGFLRMRRRLKTAVEGLPLPVRRVLARLAA